jgi:colanic acid biosynthesis glycosyl transferase WcaI
LVDEVAATACEVIVRLLEESGAGVSVPPDELAGLLKAVDDLLENQDRRLDMGARGREWVMKHASPITAAVAYEKVLAGTEIG